jgi:hypothetical protein
MDMKLELAVPAPARDDDREFVQLLRQTGREPQILSEPRPAPRQVWTVNHRPKRTDQLAAHARHDFVVNVALLGRHFRDRRKVKAGHKILQG